MLEPDSCNLNSLVGTYQYSGGNLRHARMHRRLCVQRCSSTPFFLALVLFASDVPLNQSSSPRTSRADPRGKIARDGFAKVLSEP